MSGIIGIESDTPNDQIDFYVVKFLSGKSPKDLWGKKVKINKEMMDKLKRKKLK